MGAFIPSNAKPLQSFKDAVNQFRPVALNVCILNSQEKGTSLVACKKPIK